ncbi:hypothetical protein BH10PSE6_BH10PSE6_38680 [soil metagenome]
MLPRRQVLRRIAYVRRNRCSVLLGGLIVFILLHPLLAESAIGASFLALGTLGILLLGLWARHARRRLLVLAGILALLTFHGIAADRMGEVHWLRPVTLVATAAFMGAITAALLRYVLDWHPITTDKVFGAVAAYVLIAFTFACLFGLLEQVVPGSFHASVPHAPHHDRFDWAAMMYFSVTVLTSTGFGEITPVTAMARALIVVEQVLGVMYVAFLIARLANRYGTKGRRG